MERGSPPDSVVTSDRRVRSPTAAKTAAWCRRFAVLVSLPMRDMALDVLHLLSPAAVIHTERFRTAGGGHFVEARLGEQQHSPGGGLLQPELDQRGCLLRVVHLRIDAVRMPGEAEEPLGLDLLHHGLPADMLVAGDGDLALRGLACYERTLQSHAEPLAELTMVGERAPHA